MIDQIKHLVTEAKLGYNSSRHLMPKLFIC